MMLHFRVHPIAAVTGQSEYDVWYEQFRDWPHFERSLGMDQADLSNAWILVAVAASPLGDYLTDTQRGVHTS